MTRIYRFLSLPKYIDLLASRSLFFARADLVNDPGEGGWLLHSILKFERAEEVRIQNELESLRLCLQRAEGNSNRHPAHFLRDEIDTGDVCPEVREMLIILQAPAFVNSNFDILRILKSYIEGREKRLRSTAALPNKFSSEQALYKQKTFLSCWHKGTPANQAMWAAYGLSGEGVAIQTTTEKLRSAVLAAKLKTSQKWYRSFGDVNYLSEHKRSDPGLINSIMIDFIDDPGAIFRFKSDPYQYESEYRSILTWTGKGRRTESGLRIPFTDNFIEGVFIDPRAPNRTLLEGCVTVLNARFGLNDLDVSAADIDPQFR
jgi:hypothetical protein